MIPSGGVRRRIVILTEDSKPATGGIAEYLHELARAASATHDVVVVTSVAGAAALNGGLPFTYQELPWFRAQAPQAGDAFPPVRQVNTALWQLDRRRRVRAQLATLAADRSDTTYILGRVSPVTDPWRRACEDLALPYHAMAYGRELVEPLPSVAARRRARTMGGARHWFAVSAATQALLGGLGVPLDRITIVPPGVPSPDRAVPTPAARSAARHAAGIGRDPFLLSVGQLRRRKGVDLAIGAFARMLDRHPALRHVIIGSGTESQPLRRQAQALGVADRVAFLDAVDDATKEALFAECTAFVLPIRRVAGDVEGYGIVFLEAARHGKAVVAGRVDGVPEAVVDGVTGLLVDTDGEIDGVAAAVARVLDDPLFARRLGSSGRARVEAECCWAARAVTFVAAVDRADTAPVARAAGVARRLPRGGDTARVAVDRLTVVAQLARQRMLWRYLRAGDTPEDLDQMRAAVGAWVLRALAAHAGAEPGARGASAGFHVVSGWAPPYPEVTGYLLPTLLRAAADPAPGTGGDVCVAAVRRAAAWLVDTRLPTGAICRKHWSKGAATPSVFNTGQVIEGWCALAIQTGDGEWIAHARASAEWLLLEQERDGCWIRSAFNRTAHSYYARVAAILGELGAHVGGADGARYRDAALRGLDWVVGQQDRDGWFDRAGFAADEPPTTHGIGYVIEGLLRGGIALGEERYVIAAERAARALLDAYHRRGRLPGRFDRGWRAAARWRCVTGDAQVGVVWAQLARRTGLAAYRAAADRIAGDVRRSVRVDPAWPERSGGVPGAWPRHGGYDPFAYPTHAAKFALDLAAELSA